MIDLTTMTNLTAKSLQNVKDNIDENVIKKNLEKIKGNIYENIEKTKNKKKKISSRYSWCNWGICLLGVIFQIIFGATFLSFLVILLIQVLGLIVNLSLEKKQDKIIELHHELCSYISMISENLEDKFYEAYVTIDYLNDKKIETKKVTELYKYLSEFDKNEPNSCFNEVGMKYNYRPASEDKVLEIEDKKENVSVKKENGFEVITDMSLIDKSIKQPLLSEYKKTPYLDNSHISNLNLKPSVFDRENKKIKRNNEYTHIEVKVGKVKVLTIDIKR